MTVDSAWVALSLLDHMGMTRLRALLDQFEQEPRAILSADEGALRRVNGIGKVIASAIRGIDLCAVEGEIARWQESGIKIISYLDEGYPARLRELPDAPPTLFLRGKMDWLNSPMVAVVGTRQPSSSGANAADMISRKLSIHGNILISGLALGIDAAAHKGALIAEGTTAAVLGNGINQVYPPEHKKLTDHILKVERGGIISEVHPDAPPSASRLVARNRIIAALSRAVIVIESNADGGAMHAARRAFELERAVYTLDLPASGNQELIANGATVIHTQDLSALDF